MNLGRPGLRHAIVSIGGLLLIVALSLALGGCVRGVAVNRLAIVDLLGMDVAENGEILLTAQVIIPARLGVGSTGSGPQGPPFFVAQATGKTVTEAISRMDRKIPRKVFFDHTHMLVIGEALAKRGVWPIIDWLIRERSVRTDLLTAVTPGKASEILEIVPSLPTVPGIGLREVAREQRVAVTSLRTFMLSLGEEGADPFLMAIAPSSVRIENEMAVGDVEIIGAGLFQGDRLVGYLDRYEAFGLQLLLGEDQRAVLTVDEADVLDVLGSGPPIGGYESEYNLQPLTKGPHVISLNVTQVKSSFFPAGDDPRRFEVDARTQVELSNSASMLDVEDTAVIRAIERVAAQQVVGRVEAALRKMQDVASDAAGLGAKVRRYRSRVWRSARSQWPILFQQATLAYNVHVDVEVTGLTTRPAGVPDNRLQAGNQGGGGR